MDFSSPLTTPPGTPSLAGTPISRRSPTPIESSPMREYFVNTLPTQYGLVNEAHSGEWLRVKVPRGPPPRTIRVLRPRGPLCLDMTKDGKGIRLSDLLSEEWWLDVRRKTLCELPPDVFGDGKEYSIKLHLAWPGYTRNERVVTIEGPTMGHMAVEVAQNYQKFLIEALDKNWEDGNPFWKVLPQAAPYRSSFNTINLNLVALHRICTNTYQAEIHYVQPDVELGIMSLPLGEYI